MGLERPKRRKRWAVVAAIVAAGSVFLLWAVFLWERATPYDNAWWLPKSAISITPGAPYRLSFEPNPDRSVLRLSRGRPHSTTTSAHGWDETLILEIDSPEVGREYRLLVDDVVATSTSSHFMCLRPGGAHGWVRVESLTDDGLVASYDITLKTFCADLRRYDQYQEEEVVFRGSRTFARASADADDLRMMTFLAVQRGPIPDSLFMAADRDDAAAIDRLLDGGADVDAQDNFFAIEGWTALHHATFYGHAAAAARLVERGADVNATDERGATPLHLAARRRECDTARLLINRNANVNALDHEGSTPLHEAADHGRYDMVTLLLDHGADINGRVGVGPIPVGTSTPLDRARRGWMPGCGDVARLLELRGGKTSAELEAEARTGRGGS